MGWYFDPSSVVYAKFGAAGSPAESCSVRNQPRDVEIVARRNGMAVTRREILALAGSAPALLAATRAIANRRRSRVRSSTSLSSRSLLSKRRNRASYFTVQQARAKTSMSLDGVHARDPPRADVPRPRVEEREGLARDQGRLGRPCIHVTEKPEAVTIDTGSLRIEFQRNPWKYAVYDKQGQMFSRSM